MKIGKKESQTRKMSKKAMKKTKGGAMVGISRAEPPPTNTNSSSGG